MRIWFLCVSSWMYIFIDVASSITNGNDSNWWVEFEIELYYMSSAEQQLWIIKFWSTFEVVCTVKLLANNLQLY